MGVPGLWEVVQPCARPTNLAALNRKRLAVDASIWIYQFLKAVRDKEGNALRNSHVVGFFRRICKLLWYGILPVFIFDGGAPDLKRRTLQARSRRREGRREDAVRTAGRLLAVQMQRAAEIATETAQETTGRRRNRRNTTSHDQPAPDQPVTTVRGPEEDEIQSTHDLVYVDEFIMSEDERQKQRKLRAKFRKQDPYHLPELDGGDFAAMARPDDPRIMSVAELEEYARQCGGADGINGDGGNSVSLYDFSKIDFDGDFFKSLPAADRYNILNAGRLRSRLRMGLSKDQLDLMFPDRMAFSRFQIERVRERNRFTQRLMQEVGMTGTDATLAAHQHRRVAGERNREYILVRNDGVEGGWALGVVSKDKDVGQSHKPIDVDAHALRIEFQRADGLFASAEEEVEDVDEEEDEEFEDIPIEGLNRLPTSNSHDWQPQTISSAAGHEPRPDEEDSLFVTEGIGNDGRSEEGGSPAMHPDESADIEQAIALSLQNQFGTPQESPTTELWDGSDPSPRPPSWIPKATEPSKPIPRSRNIAGAINGMASAAISTQRHANDSTIADEDSDDDMDLMTALAQSRKRKQLAGGFDGPLPFPKLDWRSLVRTVAPDSAPLADKAVAAADLDDSDDGDGGGFVVEEHDAAPRPLPLPPWLVDDRPDIRDRVRQQQEAEREINDQDRAQTVRALQQAKRQDGLLIDLEESSDDAATVRAVTRTRDVTRGKSAAPLDETVAGESVTSENFMATKVSNRSTSHPTSSSHPGPTISIDSGEEDQVGEKVEDDGEAEDEVEKGDEQDENGKEKEEGEHKAAEERGEGEFENVLLHDPNTSRAPSPGPSLPGLDDATEADAAEAVRHDRNDGDDEFDTSDQEDVELLEQMAQEAEEHARFASTLNNRPQQENREDYERELRTLRGQQRRERRDADEVTMVMVGECQALLQLFGIPYVTAPMEAEAQCAALVELGLVDGIVTDDSDTFLFGGTRVYKNFFAANKLVECYLTTDLERELSLSRHELISLAHLLGSDYTEGLPGIGPVSAIEILSEFPGPDGLEQFRDWWQRGRDAADSSSRFRTKFRHAHATKLFLPPGFPGAAVAEAYVRPIVDRSPEPFQWGVPDLTGLRRFLSSTVGWSPARTDEVLVPVIRDLNRREREGTQSNITRFFSTTLGVGAHAEPHAPRVRLGAGSRRMAAAVGRLRAHRDGGQTEDGDEPVLVSDRPAAKKRPRKKRRLEPGEQAEPADPVASENQEAQQEQGQQAQQQ